MPVAQQAQARAVVETPEHRGHDAGRGGSWAASGTRGTAIAVRDTKDPQVAVDECRYDWVCFAHGHRLFVRS